MDKPMVSFVVPMKEMDFRVVDLLTSIKGQAYPQEKVEIIVVDGGSNPRVLEACRSYGARIFFNEKGRAEGKGMGKDQGIWKSNGKYVVIAEADIRLIGTNWINEMVRPLEEDDSLFGSVPRLYVERTDNVANRYFSYVGVDPFAAFRSLEGQLALDRVPLEDMGKYFRVRLNPRKPYCMGSNGFMFRKDLIEKVGDYAQDVEFIARLAKKGFRIFALPKNAKVFHANVKGSREFFRKRIRWAKNYTEFYIREKKDFVWITDKFFFLTYVLKNLLFVPNVPVSLRNCIRYRDRAWFLHAPLLFATTVIYLVFALRSRLVLRNMFSGQL